MSPIEISVIVPTYKRPALLTNCLSRLINQSLEKNRYEVIVVSDGPVAESPKVLEELTGLKLSNIHFLSLSEKKGPAAARNLGWQRAQGTLVAFTDDDCLPAANWLETILFAYNDQDKIAYTGSVIVPVSGNPTDFELNTKGLETGEFVTANCVLTKAALELVGGFDEAFKAAWREDSDIHFKLINAGIPITRLYDAIVTHPARLASWGVSIKEQKKSMYNALLYKKHPQLYRQRIKARPNRRYYLIILFFMLFLFGVILGVKWLTMIAFTLWIMLTVTFAAKRLSASRKTGSHIFEMVVTSFAIPFLSVYWTLYGAIKYRVLFF